MSVRKYIEVSLTLFLEYQIRIIQVFATLKPLSNFYDIYGRYYISSGQILGSSRGIAFLTASLFPMILYI